jgi:hypothetical protein
MSHLGRLIPTAVAAACLGVGASPALGQVSVPGVTTYTQDFNTLTNSGTATWANNTTLPGWFAAQQSGAVSNYTADDGNGSDGGLYSYGLNPVTDRAFGGLTKNGSPAESLAYGVVFQNTGTEPLLLHVQYNGEWWRDGNATTPEALRFTYKFSSTLAGATDFDASGLTAAGFTHLPALDFDPIGLPRGPAGPRDGNADPKTLAADLGGVAFDPGEYVSLRWLDVDVQANDDGFGVDNMSVTFTPVPEPGTAFAAAVAGLALVSVVRRVRRPR